MEKIRTIIIEDESPARMLLKNYLLSHPRIEIIDECADGFEGAKKIMELQPDLVFLDIQMPRLTGFEMLELLDHEKLPIIIFTTAYDEFAIKAFEFNACDYLLKPLAKDRFDKAVIKAIEKFTAKSAETSIEIDRLLKQTIARDKHLNRIVVRSGNHIHVIPAEELICLEANDDYVIVHTLKDQLLKKQTLRFYEERLDPSEFMRVHRSFIVKLEAINRIEPYSKDAFVAILSNGFKVSVSKAGYSRLKEILNF
jgi:two-component system, LytTR family, response regulator